METYRKHTFSSFLNRHERQAKKHLKLLERILKENGLEITSFSEDKFPYIHVKSPMPLSFGGLKIYIMNDGIIFRCQDDASSGAFGKAYKIDIDEMYNDFLAEKDNINEEKAAKRTVKAIVEELKEFFEKSKDAEQSIRRAEIDKTNDPVAGYASNRTFDMSSPNMK